MSSIPVTARHAACSNPNKRPAAQCVADSTVNDESFRSIAAGHLMRAVYQQIKAAGGINE